MGPAPTRVNLLKGFALTAAQLPVALPLSAQRVLGFLALHGGPAARAFVAGSLWPDSPEDRAHANLRSALWRLRAFRLAVIETSGHQLSLAAGVVVDLRESELLARMALEGGPNVLELRSSAFDGDLLPDWYDDWIVLERERYRQLRLRALDALCERLTMAGRFDAALDAGLSSIVCDPLRESAHRAVVRLHLAEDNVGEALRQYRLCARLLRDGLGIRPSDRMEDLLAESMTRRAESTVPGVATAWTSACSMAK